VGPERIEVANADESVDPKHQELRTLIGEALQEIGLDDAERLADQVEAHYANVTPPSVEVDIELPPTEMVTVRPGGRGGGVTTKPGNVVLNLRKLITAIASGALTIAGTAAVPWMLVVGALVTWDRLYSSAQLEINEVQACVAWSLWVSRDAAGTLAKVEVFDVVNRERENFGQQPLSVKEVDYALQDLERMGCIQQSRSDPDRWWLREWVRVRY
jgi:hypothetical protein